jgi:hypothetical protein
MEAVVMRISYTLQTLFGFSFVLGLGSGSPLQARSPAAATRVATAAITVVQANPLALRTQRYCVTEAINSRIPRRIGRSAQQWSAVGVDVDLAH